MTTETEVTTAKRIEITLSERSPVRIDPEQWPVIAHASTHDGKVACQANTEWEIKVREHADGRRIVYGSCTAGNGGQYAGFRPSFGGWIITPDEDTVRAIRRVAGLIGDDDLGAECIAELPAEEI